MKQAVRVGHLPKEKKEERWQELGAQYEGTKSCSRGCVGRMLCLSL
jgi:hypothetical protein